MSAESRPYIPWKTRKKSPSRANPFNSRGKYSKFVYFVNRRLKSRERFSYADVMRDFLKGSELPSNISLTKLEEYGDLKKAFSDVALLFIRLAGEDCILEFGNNRDKSFQYVGDKEDPLEKLQNETVALKLQEYMDFCQDSAGFFPSSWLEYFLEGSIDLSKMAARRKKGTRTLISSLDRDLTNIHLLPQLYEHVKERKVLDVKYRPYGKEARTLVFHPHLLKEYNGRWFLFGHAQRLDPKSGHAEGLEPEFGYNLALDRIVDFDESAEDHAYVDAPAGFYDELFNDVVGVSHVTDLPACDVEVKIHDLKMFNLIVTKKIHHSQKTLKEFGQHVDGEYGVVSLHVRPNVEFYARILEKGPDVEVIAPAEVRAAMAEKTGLMACRYL